MAFASAGLAEANNANISDQTIPVLRFIKFSLGSENVVRQRRYEPLSPNHPDVPRVIEVTQLNRACAY
jgi:hypothetical protein